MTKKQITILIIIFLTVSLLVFVFLKIVLNNGVTQEETQALKNKTLTTSEESFPTESGTNYTVKSGQDFTVTYTEIDDKYAIFIQPQAREGLNSQEFQNLIQSIENKFLSEVLETDNQELACSLNVSISTIGNTEPILASSLLSFCN